jgi:phosphoribosylanthranilate isomerase
MNLDEARLAIRLGANALGLVGAMPSGPGVIPDDRIAEIIRGVPPPVATFLLTSEQSVDGIVAHHQRVHSSVIQIVDKIPIRSYGELRERLPGIKLVQVLHVMDERSRDEAAAVSVFVNALLLDSGRPDLVVKELGGTGRTHNWEISRSIRELVQIPVFLAGGLKAENVRGAISCVQPFGVDVCSGVRTHGALDPVKVSAFIRAAMG